MPESEAWNVSQALPRATGLSVRSKSGQCPVSVRSAGLLQRSRACRCPSGFRLMTVENEWSSLAPAGKERLTQINQQIKRERERGERMNE